MISCDCGNIRFNLLEGGEIQCMGCREIFYARWGEEEESEELSEQEPL